MTKDTESDLGIVAELIAVRPWFEIWHSVSEFDERYWEIRRLINPRIHFTRREARWLQEAYLLLKFAKLKRFEKIRLNHDDPPDAYFVDREQTVPIEITEIIEPGRRRGDEYSEDRPEIEEDPVEDWIKRAEDIPGALATGLLKKKQKKYTADTELLIYLNIDEWGIEQTSIEHKIRYSLSLPTDPFFRIHILWKGKLFSSDGTILSDPVPFDDDLGDDEEIFKAAFDDTALQE